MRSQMPFRLSTAGDGAALAVRDDLWQVQMRGVRRVGSDWFVQVLALGPRECSFTIRVEGVPYEAATARRMLQLVSDYLHGDVIRSHVYLELTDRPDASWPLPRSIPRAASGC
jgi:hypothetical protein